MERRANSGLKRGVFSTAGADCRPAVALTSVARKVRVWSNVKLAIRSQGDEEAVSTSL